MQHVNKYINIASLNPGTGTGNANRSLCSPISDFMTNNARISPKEDGWKRTWGSKEAELLGGGFFPYL